MKQLFFAFFLFSGIASAQKEASQWHFGTSRHVNFLTNPPTPSNNSAIWAAIEGCASIADASGNLQFYTNGGFVWDKNHNQMNGFLGGNPSSVQSSLIIKKSGTQYYVFTTGAFGAGSFGYSIVDMALAGGAGSITASYTLLDSVAEKMSATLHCNGISTWVMVHKMGNNAFYAYLASPAGVSSTPVVTNIGPMYAHINFAYGNMKFSPNGNKLAVSSSPATLPAIPLTIPKTTELYDFDKVTGILSNSVLIGIYFSEVRGVEFSPDGSKVYCVNRKSDTVSPSTDRWYFLQWNLCASPIASSVGTVSSISTGAQGGPLPRLLQNAIDGKIYFNARTFTWGRINSPNSTGTLCNIDTGNVITFTNTPALVGTPPNFLTNYFRQKASFTATIASPTTNACGTVSFNPQQFCAGTGNVINAYKWLFGDPPSGVANTSTLSNASHVYSANGNYTVGLITYYNCFTDTTYQTISITGLPALSIGGKSTICSGEKLVLSFSGANNYLVNGNAANSTVSLSPTSTTIYTISAFNAAQCQVNKTFTVTVLPCVSIAEHNTEAVANIYPNPTNGIFKIELPERSVVFITDVMGKEVYKQTLEIGSAEINLNDCSSGIYFIDIKNKNGTRIYKLLKE